MGRLSIVGYSSVRTSGYLFGLCLAMMFLAGEPARTAPAPFERKVKKELFMDGLWHLRWHAQNFIVRFDRNGNCVVFDGDGNIVRLGKFIWTGSNLMVQEITLSGETSCFWEVEKVSADEFSGSDGNINLKRTK